MLFLYVGQCLTFLANKLPRTASTDENEKKASFRMSVYPVGQLFEEISYETGPYLVKNQQMKWQHPDYLLQQL